jgi:cyclopropane fatty-acyl-phospholipid synthase-like methyltransferase
MKHTTTAGPTRKEIRAKLLQLYQLVIAKRIQYHKAYQPIWAGQVRSRKTIRNCEDRWEMVRATVAATGAKNLIDLGCAEGYFVRKAGELGCFALGVDRDYNRLGLIEAARMIDRSERSGFILSNIDEDLLSRLPQFDVVLCFSVMHHIIRHNSVEYGLARLRQMRSITRKAFLFDMGQTNEVSTGWADKLPYMGDDPVPWISSFLKEGGFNNIEVIGETDAYRDDVKRYVFRCMV